jgi:Txe/YoeB family toxin of Txe-Axe toxin-antitoxin module
MNKSELKKVIKPLVKECIHEVLIEEGLLSNVVTEVTKGLQAGMIVENTNTSTVNKKAEVTKKTSAKTRKKINEHRAKLMNAINKDAYNGVDLFEGTQPMTSHETAAPKPGAVDLGNPSDSGVDISSLMGGASKIWNAMK